MAVANTYTLERLWGSRIVVKNMGFLLNNNMFSFNLFPGVTDTKGTIGTAAQRHRPGQAAGQLADPDDRRPGRPGQARHREPRHQGHSQHHRLPAGKPDRLSNADSSDHRGPAIVARMVPRSTSALRRRSVILS